ncbi:YidC/Oxa1 family membrane protein insertase [bacterium]|nr:YidC/Oxa1 family membrane protein insertase [bacterium]
MGEILYTLIILPIESVLSFVYQNFKAIFGADGLTIIFLSIFVNILTLPLYNMAEKWQNEERDIQKKMKKKLEDIKAVFKGRERYMITQTYYRQNHYHPIYSLRSVIGLAIQVPFFIAAFQFLNNLESLKFTSYYIIHDLSRPDALLSIGGFSINILPILMTVINLVSLFVYSSKLTVKESVQLSGMAVLFLFILYNSPSGLVLYWTFNNICSLIKNVLYLKPNPLRSFRNVMISLFAFLFAYSFLLYFPIFIDALGGHKLDVTKGIIFNRHILFGTILILIPNISRILGFLSKIFNRVIDNINSNPKKRFRLLLLSTLAFTILTSLVIPTSLITSDAGAYFSYLSSGESLFDLFKMVILEGFAFFMFFPMLFYALFKGNARGYLIFITTYIIVSALVNTYIFSGDYGVINSELIFESNRFIYNDYLSIPNLLLLIALLVGLYFLIRKKGIELIQSLLVIAVLALSSISVINLVKIYGEYSKYLKTVESSENSGDQFDKIYTLSKTKQNVLVIMLDKAVPSYFGDIINFESGVKERYDGFTWYPNTISVGRYTLLAVASLFGGYEYTPMEINKRENKPLVESHNEALLVLPLIFKEKGYESTFTDASLAGYNSRPDNSIFKEYGIRADNVMGKYSRKLMAQYYKSKEIFNTKKDMIKFALFRTAPVIVREDLYDKGRWFKANYNSKTALGKEFIHGYSQLEYLSELFNYDSDKNQYIAIVNETPHYPAILFPPTYRPTLDKKSQDEKLYNQELLKYAEIEHYSVNAASIMRVGEFLDKLKENGVYDNTKIIIVSDHGSPVKTRFFSGKRKAKSYSKYNPLLLVKDFNSRGELKISNEFMSNADTPYLATSHLNDVVNPFTKNPIVKHDKTNGFEVLTSTIWKIREQGKFKFKYNQDEIIKVKDNIFDEKNWEGKIK